MLPSVPCVQSGTSPLSIAVQTEDKETCPGYYTWATVSRPRGPHNQPPVPSSPESRWTDSRSWDAESELLHYF